LEGEWTGIYLLLKMGNNHNRKGTRLRVFLEVMEKEDGGVESQRVVFWKED
jgi:hypothetical protein